MNRVPSCERSLVYCGYERIRNQIHERVFIDKMKLLQMLVVEQSPERSGSVNIEKFLRGDINQTAARLQKRQRTFEEKQVEIETTLSRDVAFSVFSRSSMTNPLIAT